MDREFCLEAFSRFEDIEVKLVAAVPSAYELSVASARTCYSGKGPVFPEAISIDEKAIALRDRIASSTLEAGHITTRQHAHFVFVINGVSRHCLWNFLHSHPFYNSEQVSQRYVRVKPGNVVMPLTLMSRRSGGRFVSTTSIGFGNSNRNRFRLVMPSI